MGYMETKPGPWVPICQDCWPLVNPDRYFPDTEFRAVSEVCAVCTEDTFAGAHERKGEIDDYLKATVKAVEPDFDGMAEAIDGFAQSNSALFVEYVKGWYRPERADAILAAWDGPRI